MDKFSDRKIIDSWKKNVRPWVKAIQGEEIESRLLVTNKAIVDIIIARKPKKVLDAGCGEGWLVRVLAEHGIDCLGIDAVTEFFQHTREKRGRFKTLSYEELSYDVIGERFDVLACNFSLLGKESVKRVFQQAPGLLNVGGSMVVQTVHPKVASEEGRYTDGWRDGTWDGFNNTFCDPAPWYFRTLESWRMLFSDAGFTNVDVVEPLNPKTKSPASVIITGVVGSYQESEQKTGPEKIFD